MRRLRPVLMFTPLVQPVCWMPWLPIVRNWSLAVGMAFGLTPSVWRGPGAGPEVVARYSSAQPYVPAPRLIGGENVMTSSVGVATTVMVPVPTSVHGVPGGVVEGFWFWLPVHVVAHV